MRSHLPRFFLLVLLFVPAIGHAEVLIRWSEAAVPPRESLGVVSLVIPAPNRDAIREATRHGHRVFVEVPAAGAAGFAPPAGVAGVVVKGTLSKVQLTALRRALPANARVLTADGRAAWPHIRTNWVTKNNDVLQVAGRSAQPWLDSNAALVRVTQRMTPETAPVLAYDWTGTTPSDAKHGPATENYLVAIAEAGSFGADLVLPLHERFQRQLLLALPEARRQWQDIRRYLDFYAGHLTRLYTPMADVGIVTSTPMLWVEVLDLLTRHNLSFTVVEPSQIAAQTGGPLETLIVLDQPDAAQAKLLAAYERAGGSVILALPSPAEKGPHAVDLQARVIERAADPNRFALALRRLLGPERRVLDIWNGITVLATPYAAPGEEAVLVTLVNYAYQPLPVQLRVRGTFARVQYESPEEPAMLLPHEHRDGRTEFVVPAVRVGGRIFLSH